MRKLSAALVLAALALAVPTAALAGNGHGNGPKDLIDVGKDVKVKKPKKQDLPANVPAMTKAAVAAASALESPPIGTTKLWPLINFNTGFANIQNFTLRAVGDKIEVWVANNLNYPAADDCRNDGVRNVVTDEQVQYLVGQFDENMYPKMTAAFSSPPSREGDGATLPALIGAPADYYAGPGDKIVTLVANFQDENYLDITFPSYVAGYHSSGINAFVNRNVMSIDSYDWLHRTGANPPHEPSTEICENTPASPFRYEGIFAHEYQHLLEFWASPGESTWVNEGLSDYAITVTGYGFPARTIHEQAWDSHVQTFLGWRSLATPFNLIPQPLGGPENSLTVWEDQGGLETLSDYGAAWTFMELLHSRYGAAFMTDLHNEDANGLAGVQAVLDKYLAGKTTRQLIHEWAAMVATDAAIDDGAKLRGAAREADYQSSTLHSSIHWANPQAYSTPGAPPNGSDYVQLRDAAGSPLTASQVRSIEFAGAEVHELLPIEWQSVEGVLSAGAEDDLDRSIIREVSVPATGNRSLTFRTSYGIETLWDFAIVQVSTDGGGSWTSLANADTTTDHDPDARASIVAQLPGLTGDKAWHETSYDLSPYAGTSVVLRLRMMTDGATLGNEGGAPAGWLVDDVRVGGVLVSDGSLDGWRSEVAAPSVQGFTVQLVGLSSDGTNPAILTQVPLADGFTGSLAGGPLRSVLGNQSDTVGAIVTYDEPTQGIVRYAPYILTVNGVEQPGG